MIASMIMNNFLFASLFNREQGGAWIIAGIVAAIVWVFSTLLMMALSRYREFAADRGAAFITEDPDALISALKKIRNNFVYHTLYVVIRALNLSFWFLL